MSASPGRVSVETAAQLLDFESGGAVSPHAAHEQLRGAVAIHNILQDLGVAYLADEVGMGKTYVALGALALFRHFDPGFRVLVVAPRENIQKKWVKELRNFVGRNVRFADLRVKAVHGAPARAPVLCNSVVELVRETAVDADRDFFARMTSFSLALGKDVEGWKKKRDDLREHLPWLPDGLMDLRNRDAFTDDFACAVNAGLPEFDLVIVDEAHNLKHGFKEDSSVRNRVLGLAFGHPSRRADARARGFTNYGPRAKRVLFLSATPLESDYVQLWNQLDVFGFGGRAAELKDPGLEDDEKRRAAQRFLVRRVTSLPVAGQRLTKNLYRREWRRGGVETHDDELIVPDDRQKLTVALVQKKVSEVIRSERFDNSFQIGMLASFESFLETARAKPAKENGKEEVQGNFDDADQTEDVEERLGIDVGSVNHLARAYRARFGSELPHAKMDAVVERLARSFETGEKALVFVRRVASVKEIQRKLEEKYDAYLFRRLRSELLPEVRPKLDEIIGEYQRLRRLGLERRIADGSSNGGASAGEDGEPGAPAERDEGGTETFFAWFFRGEPPKKGILSGATMQNRFSQASATYSTFFEENHVAYLLDAQPGGVADALAAYLGQSKKELAEELEWRAAGLLPRTKKQQRRKLFPAFQGAAVSLLAEHDGPLQETAKVVREERYGEGDLTNSGAADTPELDDWLETKTVWTALRARPALRAALWPEPDETKSDFRKRFREQELRRELFSAMARLGHPFIDLYVLAINRLGSLEMRTREQSDEEAPDLTADFLDLLERQAAEGTARYTSFRELAEAAANFDLILAVNQPGVRDEPLAGAATAFGKLLRAQQPVGGMFGGVNDTLVRQFRMPGYPLVLVTTDLLQEGEDLHTFCSTVHHYGISWMPSSMEQRVGRVDRVSSQTDRRLTRPDRTSVSPDELLQVHYPHLRATVELLQVERVLERLNKFLVLMHENLGGQNEEDRRLDVTKEILGRREIRQITEPLETAFPVREDCLKARPRKLAVGPSETEGLRERFLGLRDLVGDGRRIEWEDRSTGVALLGTIRLRTRRQPFTLLLRSVAGRPVVRCVSPVGVLHPEVTQDEIADAVRGLAVRVGAVFDQRFESYDLTIEGDVLLGARSADPARVGELLERVTEAADRLEERLLGGDRAMEEFREDLEEEAAYER